jgi:hypothetical protein
MASSAFLSHGRMIRLEASRVFQISRSTSPTHICSDHFASLKRFAVMWWMPALRMGILRRRKGNAPGRFSDEFLPTAFGCASSNLGIPAIKHYIYRSRLASASRTIPDNKKGKPARLVELQAAAVTDSGVLLVNRELGRF